MNCIIGADKISCNVLEEFVGKSSSLNLIGSFSDIESARNQLSNGTDTDLAFLDIDTLEMGILNYINCLDYQPNIIIVSSSGQNAVEAFNHNVVDYLLKPLTYSRFFKAVDKAIKFCSHKEDRDRGDNEVLIKKGSALVRLQLKEIIYVEALENYVTLNTTDDRFAIHFTTKAIENQLPSGIFIRVHPSYIINKSMIQVIKESSLDLNVGSEIKNIPVWKSFREPLLNNLNMLGR